MKKTFAIMVFACLFVANVTLAGIQIGFPKGGEKLPMNGIYSFYWTNSEPLIVEVYINHYDNVTNLDWSLPLFTYNRFFYIEGVGSAFFPDLFEPMDLVTNGFYKVSYIGVTKRNVWYTNETPEFFRVTPEATIHTTFNYTNSFWKRGEQKSITVSWEGFDIGDKFDVYLNNLEQVESGHYGFIYKDNELASESGSMTIALDYPTTNQAIRMIPPADGLHGFMVSNTRTGLGYYYGDCGAVDVVVSDLRIRLSSPNDRTYVFPEGGIRALKVELDTRFAPTNKNVEVSSLAFALWSNTNILMDVEMNDVNTNALSRIVNGLSASGDATNTVSFPNSKHGIAWGTVETLFLDCFVRSNANYGYFRWTIPTNNTITAVTSDGEPLTVGLMYQFANTISVFAQQGARIQSFSPLKGGREIALVAECHTDTRYSIERSVDLRNWSIMEYVVTTNYSLQTVVTNSGDKGFFRILERPL